MTIGKSEFNTVESITGGTPVITTDHALIHDSKAFSVFEIFTIAAAGVAYLELKTNTTTYVHFKPTAMQSDGPKITIELVEAPVVTTGVTALTPVCRHRLRPTVSTVVVKNNPTGVSGGTVLDKDYIGGGTGAGASTASGGNVSNDNEWVLKQNTTYLIRVTNGGNGAASVSIKAFWYEEGAA